MSIQVLVKGAYDKNINPFFQKYCPVHLQFFSYQAIDLIYRSFVNTKITKQYPNN